MSVCVRCSDIDVSVRGSKDLQRLRSRCLAGRAGAVGVCSGGS